MQILIKTGVTILISDKNIYKKQRRPWYNKKIINSIRHNNLKYACIWYQCFKMDKTKTQQNWKEKQSNAQVYLQTPILLYKLVDTESIELADTENQWSYNNVEQYQNTGFNWHL